MAVRGAVNIPVIGACIATYHLAYQLASKFGVISVSKDLNSVFLRAIKQADCEGRMTSMRAIDKPLKLPMEDFYTPAELEEEIMKIAKKQIEDEGAQLIVVACTVISLLLAPGGLKRLAETLGVIFVDPQEIAVKTAEMIVTMGLSHSKIEYPQIKP